MEKEFFNEIRERNKAKFISIVSKDIEKQQKKEGGIHIPSFLEAETAYNEFQKAGCFDQYGYLKPINQ
jgi:hypothetical protein